MTASEHVFLSYSHKDAELMRRVRGDLVAHGITVWTDEGIEPGTRSWRSVVGKAIEACKCVVVIFSPDAKQSAEVRKELDYASNHDKTIFPLLARGDKKSAVAFGYDAQWIDIRDNYDLVVSVLIPTLHKFLKIKPPRQTPAAQPINADVVKSNVPKTISNHSNTINVLIVDDHSMVRKGLKVLLEDFADIAIVAEASDGQEALDLCEKRDVDVVLMDMMMPRMDGIEATRRIREKCPNTQVIALTSFNDDAKVSEAFKAGMIGYLMKNVSGEELANAVRRAAQGQSTLAPEAAQALISATTKPPAIGSDLTEREREVLVFMIEGLNNREIGERLFISGSTVKNHVSSILAKLGTVSRTQAVAIAVENRIID